MSGKVIIVTGASRGIGHAICQHLLAPPQLARLVVVARSADALASLKAACPERVAVVAGDVTDYGLAERAVGVARESFGGGGEDRAGGNQNQIDGLVINHGTVGQVARLEESDLEEWKKGFDVNFFSAAAFIKATIPHLRASHGRVIFTSTGASVTGYKGWGLYGASKAACNHLGMTLARQEPAITSLSVRPGMVDTQMQSELRAGLIEGMEEDGQRLKDAYYSGKLLKPEQPAAVIANLALRADSRLSGKFFSWNDAEMEPYQGK